MRYATSAFVVYKFPLQKSKRLSVTARPHFYGLRKSTFTTTPSLQQDIGWTTDDVLTEHIEQCFKIATPTRALWQALYQRQVDTAISPGR